MRKSVASKDVPITLRFPKVLLDFFDKYSQQTNKSKKSIFEQKILEKISSALKDGEFKPISVRMDLKSFSRKVDRERVRMRTKGEDKITIFISNEIDELVCKVADATLLKPSDIYRLALIEFYNEHKDEVNLNGNGREEILKEIRNLLSNLGK